MIPTFEDELFLQLVGPGHAVSGGDEAVDTLALDAVRRRHHGRLRDVRVLNQSRLDLATPTIAVRRRTVTHRNGQTGDDTHHNGQSGDGTNSVRQQTNQGRRGRW